MQQGGAGGRRCGPVGHRTGRSEGVHVRGDLCVVFGGGCAGVTWTRVCLCVCVEGGVHYRDKWCVRAGYRDVGIPLSRRGCVEKVTSQVTGLHLGGCTGGCLSAEWAQKCRRSTQLASLRIPGKMHWLPPQPALLHWARKIVHPLCARPCPKPTDSGDTSSFISQSHSRQRYHFEPHWTESFPCSESSGL